MNAEDDTFEDRIPQPHEKQRAEKDSQAREVRPAKRKKVSQWQGDDSLTKANTAANRGNSKRPAAAAATAKLEQQPSKRRRAASAAPLPPPPPFPVVPAESYPPFPSISASLPLSTLSHHLSALIQAVAGLESAAVQEAYGDADGSGPHSFLTRYARSALDGWAVEVEKQMGTKISETPRKGRSRASTAVNASPSTADQPDPSLPLYAHLAAALSSILEQQQQSTAALTSSATSAPPLVPSLPASTTAFLSASVASASPSLSSLIRQGYGSLSVDSDVVVAELKAMKEQVDQHRAWREHVSARINRKVVGGGEDADEDDDEAEGQTLSARKKGQVKKLISQLTTKHTP